MAASQGSKRPGQPNIIFIMADDLGYQDLGCYGQTRIQTPNIDAMAQEGLRFTNCYAGASVCAPCRSVLMTGLHTGHTRVRGNTAVVGGILVTDDGGPQRRVGLESKDTTIAELLQQAGYATGITGKWGLAEPETEGIPTRKGFDQWFGYLNQRRAHEYYPPFLWRNEEKVLYPENAEGQKVTYSHDLFAQFALDFVREHKNKPFFLYLAYTLPHAKYEIPSVEPYEREDWPEDAKVHAAMITRLDRNVGDLMDLLKKLDLDRDTIVFFCSDNGAARRWDGIFDSSGPLREKKGSLYEGGIRVPMIVRWPGKVPAGQTSDTPWYFADILPTFLELAGAPAMDGTDGASVVPTLMGKEQDLKDRFLYWEHLKEGKLQQAVRLGDLKAFRPHLTEPLELYDLSTDPEETTDIASVRPRDIQRIQTYLETARTDSIHWPVERGA